MVISGLGISRRARKAAISSTAGLATEGMTTVAVNSPVSTRRWPQFGAPLQPNILSPSTNWRPLGPAHSSRPARAPMAMLSLWAARMNFGRFPRGKFRTHALMIRRPLSTDQSPLNFVMDDTRQPRSASSSPAERLGVVDAPRGPRMHRSSWFSLITMRTCCPWILPASCWSGVIENTHLVRALDCSPRYPRHLVRALECFPNFQGISVKHSSAANG